MAKGLVLVFHKEEDSSLFEKIILALKARYSLVSADQLELLLKNKKNTANVCHITFDDGVASFYTVIFPLLKKHQVPVSLFVSPEMIKARDNFWFQEIEGYEEGILKNILVNEVNISPGKLAGFSCQTIFKCLPLNQIKNVIARYQQNTKCEKKAPQNISAAQLQEADASGLVAVGAHTINHPVLRNEDDENCRFEIAGSVKVLEKMLGHPVKYFAYPNGRPGIDFGEREMNYLKESGITMAFSTELDTLSAENNLLSIPRMGFARMGLAPSNPLIKFRLNLGKRWIDVRSIGKPTEKDTRDRLKGILGKELFPEPL